MMRLVFLSCIFCMLICGLLTAFEDDPIEKKLATAKVEYDKLTEKARGQLVTDLKKKRDMAQKAGDLKTLKKAEEELKALEDKGELPKVIATKNYENDMRKVQAKLETAYELAVREYTMAGKVAQATAVQKELDDFKASNPLQVARWKQTFPVGQYSTTYASGGTPGLISLQPDNTFTWVRGKKSAVSGTIGFMDGTLVLKADKDIFVETWTIEKGKILAKHWFPADKFNMKLEPQVKGEVTRSGR